MPLHLDVEDDGIEEAEALPSAPARPARKRIKLKPVPGCCTLDDAPAGPASAEEAVLWAMDDLQAMRSVGMEHFKVDFQKRVLEVLIRGVGLVTDYSGIGGAEEAQHQILLAARALLERGQPQAGSGQIAKGKVCVRRACDILPYARSILAKHEGECKPRCVQGNMLDRLPAKLLKRLRCLHARHVISAKAQIAKLLKPQLQTKIPMQKRGCKAKAKTKGAATQTTPRPGSLAEQRKRILEVEGRKFVLTAAKFLLQGLEDMSAEDIANIKAHCDVHGKECPSFPKLPKHFTGLLGSIAGLSCYDWSSMGKTMRWLGDSVFPFFRVVAGAHAGQR